MSSNDKEMDPDKKKLETSNIGFVIMACILTAAGIFLHVGLLVIMLCSSKLRKPQHFLVANQSFADLVFLCLAMPLAIASRIMGTWPIPCSSCNIIGLITVMSVHASMANIAAVSFNRFLNVSFPLWYIKYWSGHSTISLITLVWTYAFLVAAPTQLGWGAIDFDPKIFSCIYDWNEDPGYSYFVLIAGLFLPLMITIAMYTAMLVIAWRRKRRVGLMTNSVGRGVVTFALRRNNLKVSIQIVIIFLLYLTCWAPYLITAILIDIDGELPTWVYDVIANMIPFYYITHPPLYCIFSVDMKKEVITMAKKFKCCRR